MRLLLRLISLKDCVYDKNYHIKLQGFFYNLIRNTEYKNLHDAFGPKLFCFSNIFPAENMKQGEKRSLIVSSPMKRFIEALEMKLKEVSENINVGEMSFKIEEIKIIDSKIEKDCALITGTPIVVRIPKAKYEKYGLKSGYEYIYWKPEHPFEPFIKQLEENLLKKFIKFYQLSKREEKMLEEKVMPLFQQFEHKKSVCNHIIISGKEQKVFGNLWRFRFNNLNKKQREVLQFGLDTGLGEKNSQGFGFMNVDRNKDSDMQKRAILKEIAGQVE